MLLRHSLGLNWRPSILSLLLVACLLLPLSQAIFTRNDCNKLTANSQCLCRPDFGNFEIDCPAKNPQIRIQLHSELQIIIDCSSTTKNYQLLPNAEIGYIEHVKIKECPLPGHLPIAGILETLGVRTNFSLHFESKNFGANITRRHLSRLQSVQRLRLSSRSKTHIPPDLFMDMPRLKWLDLRSNEALPVDIFVPLENLDFLELAYNRFTELPAGIFRKQQKLHDLNLWSNELRNLTKDVFEGASALTSLELTDNGIEELQPDVFEYLTRLETISLNKNNISQLPVGLFQHNKNLSHLTLNHNMVPLVTLPSRLLADKPNLQIVSFICGLETLPGDLFAGSGAITNITLYRNQLRTLPAELFRDQVHLLNLKLFENQLEILPDSLFRNTRSLTDLDLSYNQLTELTNEIFSSLENLQTLNLQGNRLTTIASEAFDRTKSLQYINMADNEITLSDPIQDARGSPFRNLNQLLTLDLHNNSIMHLYDDWKFSLLHLQQLDLSHNNITSLDYKDLQYLTRNDLFVNLSHNLINQIDFLDILLLNNTKIEMELNNNPIDCNCVLLNFVQFVRSELQFNSNYGNNIRLLTDQLQCDSPANLQGKNVAEVEPKQLLCPLDYDSKQKRCPTGCSCWVRSYDAVLMVNCSNSNFTRVPPLPRLEPLRLKATELYVEHNQIMKLPMASTPGYADVTKIFAANNNITRVLDYNLPYGLTHLDLRRNQLNYLNDSAIQMLNESLFVQSLQLSENPWHCDCLAKPFLVFTQNKYKVIKDLQDIECFWRQQSKKLQLLSVSDICPVNKTLLIAGAIVISLIGFLIGITAALYYKYQLEIKVWLYAHNLCLWFVSEEELDKDKKYDGFVSYSHHDKEFVENYLVPQLEKGQPAFKLCVHERDFQVGGRIAEQIVQNIDDSRRTIVVLSKHFIESMWGRMEFQTAHKSALTEGRARIIVIIYGDIGDIEQLDGELKAYLKMNTYVKWGDPWFWDKLRYAMPHPKNRMNGGLVKTPLKGSTDDKLELIKPTAVTPTLTTPPAEATKNPLVAHLNGNTPQTAVMIPNGKLPAFYTNGKVTQNGHVNGAFIINTNAKQSDV